MTPASRALYQALIRLGKGALAECEKWLQVQPSQTDAYWLAHYVDPETHLCKLCQNTGELHTATGSRAPCLCPNGRSLAASSR